MMELSPEDINKDLTLLDDECQCSHNCDCKYLNDDTIQMALTALGKKSIMIIIESPSR